jgi:hypothetical protein
MLAIGWCVVILAVAGCGPKPSPTESQSPVPATEPPPTEPQAPVPATEPSPSVVFDVTDPRFGAMPFGGGTLNVTTLPCAVLQKIGVRSTFFGAWWGQIEAQPGQLDWSSVDGSVDAALACGVEPVIKISAGAGPGQESAPPQDMDAYARFVSALARHLKGRVRAYAVENEINNPRLAWTAETYGVLRAAAYAAIKRADPEAEVLDSGLTMEAYLPARANELVQAGKVQDAISMLQRFEASMTRTPRNLPSTEQALVQWLRTPNNQLALEMVAELRDNPETYDTVQLHYLQDAWEMIPEYVSWAKAWFPGKRFEFWEIGYGWAGEETDQPFSEESHAAGIVITLVSALGEGASRVIYEPYWEDTTEGAQAKESRRFGRGLVTPEGPRLAGESYGTMTRQLGGYQKAERLDLGGGTWTYRFATPRGYVYVVWARQDTTVRLPVPADWVTVTDIAGSTSQADSAALPVGASPVFVTAP